MKARKLLFLTLCSSFFAFGGPTINKSKQDASVESLKVLTEVMDVREKDILVSMNALASLADSLEPKVALEAKTNRDKFKVMLDTMKKSFETKGSKIRTIRFMNLMVQYVNAVLNLLLKGYVKTDHAGIKSIADGLLRQLKMLEHELRYKAELKEKK